MKNLYDEMMKELRVTRVSLAQLAKQIDASPQWVYKVRDGDIPDPGVKKTQALYEAMLKAKRSKR